jgi:uncharacterized phage protein (TIGR02216 family)
MSRFPWQTLMAAGMGLLGHSSEAFWRMSLPELSAAIDLRSDARTAPPDRLALNELMHRFPDRTKDADRN